MNTENVTSIVAEGGVSGFRNAPAIQVANPKPLEAWQPEYLNPSDPGDEASLDTLGQFARTAARKGAEHLWELGRAIVLAKLRAGNRKEFGEWMKQWIPDVNERTRQRAVKVGILNYDTIKGKAKDEVYTLLF